MKNKGPRDVLTVGEMDEPQPLTGEVVIRVALQAPIRAT